MWVPPQRDEKAPKRNSCSHLSHHASRLIPSLNSSLMFFTLWFFLRASKRAWIPSLNSSLMFFTLWFFLRASKRAWRIKRTTKEAKRNSCQRHLGTLKTDVVVGQVDLRESPVEAGGDRLSLMAYVENDRRIQKTLVKTKHHLVLPFSPIYTLLKLLDRKSCGKIKAPKRALHSL